MIVVFGALVFLVAAATPVPPPPPAAPAAQPAPAPPGPPRDAFFFSSGGSWLGVSIADVTSERARDLKLKEERGAEIRAVLPGSPAAEAGVKEGDVILEFQGNRVEGCAQLTRMVRETPPGRTVALEVWRDGSPKTIRVKVAEHERPHGHGRMIERQRIEIPHIDIPEIDIPEIEALGSIPSSIRLGASVENLTEQLGEYFGVKGGEGALVRSVRKGSPGDEAGLRAGDVIQQVGREPVETPKEAAAKLKDAKDSKKPVLMKVYREGSTRFVAIAPRAT